jgi:hypothetical protein
MDPITWTTLAALVKKLVDLVRFLRGGDWDGFFTTAAALAAGAGVVLLAGGASASLGLSVGDISLTALNWQAQTLVGLALGASGSVVLHDIPARFDTTVVTESPPKLISGR